MLARMYKNGRKCKFVGHIHSAIHRIRNENAFKLNIYAKMSVFAEHSEAKYHFAGMNDYDDDTTTI